MRANIIRVYSTSTGEWIRDLDEVNRANPTIINIQNMPNSPTILVGCTVAGDIVAWKYKVGTIDTVFVSVFQQ